MRTFLTPIALALAASAPSCKGAVPPPGAPAGVAMASITVTSKSFPSNGDIPVDYTCDGKEISPQLTWSAPPQGTKSITIEVDDPDASSGIFTHWLVYGLSPDATQLAEGVDPSTLGARIGLNDFEQARYGGPCPPKMQIHRYRFQVLALDAMLDLGDGADRTKLDTAMNGHVLGQGTLYGEFSH